MTGASTPLEDSPTDRSRPGHGWRLPLGIVLAAFLLRLALAAPGLSDPGTTFSRPDTPTYLEPARALLLHHRYDVSPADPTPSTLRPPGFSLLLAALLGLSGGSLGPIAVVLCALSAWTCIPIFLAVQDLGGRLAGAVAASAFALNLTSIANAPMILSDTFYAFLAALQLLFFVRFYRSGRILDLAACALLASLATFVRPVGLLWLGPLLVLALAAGRVSWKKRILTAGLAGLIFLGCLLPWMVRNEHVGAGFRLHTNVGSTLLNYIVPAALAEKTGEPAPAIRERIMQETEREFAAHPERYATEGERVDYELARAKGILRKNLPAFLRVSIQPFVLLPDAPTFFEVLGFTRSGRGTTDIMLRKGPLAAVRHYFGDKTWLLLPLLPLLAVVAATYCGALVQLLRWVLSRRGYCLLAFLSFTAYYLILPGPIVMPRYHLPALPFMCLMAGLAISKIIDGRQKGHHGAGVSAN